MVPNALGNLKSVHWLSPTFHTVWDGFLVDTTGTVYSEDLRKKIHDAKLCKILNAALSILSEPRRRADRRVGTGPFEPPGLQRPSPEWSGKRSDDARSDGLRFHSHERESVSHNVGSFSFNLSRDQNIVLSVECRHSGALKPRRGGGGRTVIVWSTGAVAECGRHRPSQGPEWLHEHQGSHDKNRRGRMTNHVLGVDISKASLDVHLVPTGETQQFANNTVGFRRLIAWLRVAP